MFNKRTMLIIALGLIALLSSCIGDDIIPDEVEPVVRILNPVDSIALGSSYTYEASYFNNIGFEETNATIVWESSNPTIIEVDQSGIAQALAMGEVAITASVTKGNETIQATNNVAVGGSTVNNNEQSGSIRTTSSYVLSGDFVIRDNGNGGITISFVDDYEASTALPGLYVYLTNNPNTTAGAKEVGKVRVFNGAHEYTVDDASLFTYSHLLYYCKPFNVKVGDGAIN